jgi:broad specificity phosphatase PhoE
MNLELTDKIGGRSNGSPLTPLGEHQSKILGLHLRRALTAQGGKPTDLHYFSSTAVRALETARLTMEELGIEDINSHLVTSDDLLEQHMGSWEGGNRADCYNEENMKKIKADTYNFAAPGGESQLQVEERMISFLNDTVLPVASPKRPVFVFGHGMAFKTVLRHVLNSDARMSRKIAIHNTAITEIGWVPRESASQSLQEGWHVLRVNDASHLQLHPPSSS